MRRVLLRWAMVNVIPAMNYPYSAVICVRIPGFNSL